VVNDNAIGQGDRRSLLFAVLACVAIVIVLYTAAHRFLGRETASGFDVFAHKANQFAVVVCLLPLFLFLRADDLGEASPFVSLGGGLIMGAIGAYVTYHLTGLGRWTAMARRSWGWVPWVFVTLGALVYAVALSYLQTVHHQALGTRDWDFGIYINTLWQSLGGNLLACSLTPGGTHASCHFDPILVLISPILLIHKSETTLTVFQSVWIASGTVPLFLLAKERLGHAAYGLALASVYLLHPAVHGQNMYDFHSIVLAGPVLMWCMYCLETERIKAYYAFLALLMLVREDTPGLAALMALYLIISGRLYRVALVTIFVAAVWGLFINLVVMADARSYAGRFRSIRLPDSGPVFSIVVTLFTNPGYVLKHALEQVRVLHLLKLLAPLMLLPLFSRRHYILFVWGAVMTFLGSWNGFYMLGTQYSVYWLPFMLAAVPTAVENIRRARLIEYLGIRSSAIGPALTVGMVLSAVAMSAMYGVFWSNSSFRPGYETFHRHTTAKIAARYETIAKVKAMVPDDASVLATRRVGQHFALRNEIWSFHKVQEDDQFPDYVIVWTRDLKRKRDKKIQIPKAKYYKESADYEKIVSENGIRVYKRKSYNPLKDLKE
jgi:uncharacterized membrane protein